MAPYMSRDMGTIHAQHARVTPVRTATSAIRSCWNIRSTSVFMSTIIHHMSSGKPSWRLSGRVLVACNCDFGCPCNFNARPSRGKCEGGWTWHVERGSFQDVSLDGLNFSIYVNWPGAIHEGNGEGLFLLDERADDHQRGAIATLMGGEVGGPWGVLAWTWPKLHGPVVVPYEIKFNGVASRVKAGNILEVESTTIRNPVTGAEVHPGVIL